MVENTANASEASELIFSDLRGKYEANAISVLAANSSLSPSYDFDANTKDVNKLFLTYINADTAHVTSADSSLLVSIANQCPLEGGHAVYRARSLLLELTGKPNIYNDQCTGQAAYNSFTNDEENHLILSETKGSVKFFVSPNPTEGLITLKFENLRVQSRLNIFDQSGRLINFFTLPKDRTTFQLDLQSTPQGVYYLQLVNEEVNLIKKVVVN